jgi:hypothetical protein
MNLRILASAKRDLQDGYEFYAAQESGVGDYFLTSVVADIDSLHLYGGIHPIVYKSFHRSLCRSFPFAIYYLKRGDTVIIHGVVDCRRNPSWIHQHLQESSREEPTP